MQWSDPLSSSLLPFSILHSIFQLVSCFLYHCPCYTSVFFLSIHYPSSFGETPAPRKPDGWVYVVSTLRYFLTCWFLCSFTSSRNMEKCISISPSYPLFLTISNKVVLACKGCFLKNYFYWSIVVLQCYISSLLYSKVNQSYVYTDPLFFRFPSHLGHHRALSGVPCAIL